MSFLGNFLQHRTFQVFVGNHRSDTINEEKAVPQRPVIAVTIFRVRMNRIFLRLPVGLSLSTRTILS